MASPLAIGEEGIAQTLHSVLQEKRGVAQKAWTEFDSERARLKGEGVDLSKDLVAFKRLDDLHRVYDEAAKEAADLQKRWERHVSDGPTTMPDSKARDGSDSIGAEFLRRLGASQVGLKALEGTSGGTMIRPFYDPRIRELPQRQLFVRSVIPVRKVEGDKVWYLRQSVHTNAAAAVAAGGLKPTSVYTVERIEETVRTIATVSEALDRALLSDFASLTDFLDGQMRLSVLLAEDNQIVNGNGTAPNLRGILNTAGIATQARGTDSRSDAIHKAITICRLSFHEPDAIVLHPNDWQTVRLEKSADGELLTGPVTEEGPERLWGKPVITSPVIALGTGLVGAFAIGATVWDREEARVTFTESGARPSDGLELFTRNQILFRAEERIAFGVERPSAFCSVTGL